MTRPVTTAERAAMRTMRRQGVPERTIARRFGRALTTVQRYVGDIAPCSARAGRTPALDAVTRAALVREIGRRPLDRIAFRFGVSGSVARRIAREAGRSDPTLAPDPRATQRAA